MIENQTLKDVLKVAEHMMHTDHPVGIIPL